MFFLSKTKMNIQSSFLKVNYLYVLGYSVMPILLHKILINIHNASFGDILLLIDQSQDLFALALL